VNIIASSADKHSRRHARLTTQSILVNRHKHLAARILVGGDQSIDVVRRQLQFGRLTRARFLLKILTPLVDRLNLRVRNSELRYWHGRLSKGSRFRQPIKPVKNRRVPVQPPIHASNASYP